MFYSLAIRTALFLLLWWALSSGDFKAWPIGASVIAVAVALSMRLYPSVMPRASMTGLAKFILFFLTRSLKGGMQVAAMALRPQVRLHPAIIEVRLRLDREPEQIFLASVLSLLPGTLSTGLSGNLLELHVLDSRLPVEQEVRDAETHIARIFRLELE